MATPHNNHHLGKNSSPVGGGAEHRFEQTLPIAGNDEEGANGKKGRYGNESKTNLKNKDAFRLSGKLAFF